MPRQLQRIFSTLAFVCVATASFAQIPGGQIRGTVTDETGGALPGVTAEARLLTGGIDGLGGHGRRRCLLARRVWRPAATS